MDIVLDSISFQYEGEKNKVLNNISLEVKKNDFFAILGKNGSGKTSLIYCLNGLIPHAISGKLSGNVLIEGKNSKKLSIAEISKKVGTVFQNPNLVIFNLTVEDEVSFGVYNLHLDHPEKRIKKALQMVGLEAMRKRDPHSLSEGQKQLLCLACVLAMGTDYIILDEPIANLDYNNSQLIYKILEDLHKQGKTIIVIEHDSEQVLAAR